MRKFIVLAVFSAFLVSSAIAQHKAPAPEIVSVDVNNPDLPVEVTKSPNRAAALSRFDAAVALTQKGQDRCSALQRKLVDLLRKDPESNSRLVTLDRVDEMRRACTPASGYLRYVGRLLKTDSQWMGGTQINEVDGLIKGQRDIGTTLHYIKELMQQSN